MLLDLQSILWDSNDKGVVDTLDVQKKKEVFCKSRMSSNHDPTWRQWRHVKDSKQASKQCLLVTKLRGVMITILNNGNQPLKNETKTNYVPGLCWRVSRVLVAGMVEHDYWISQLHVIVYPSSTKAQRDQQCQRDTSPRMLCKLTIQA